MINRIFKTILVLSIVLGITLPSNAAVSVSDGSAFVTKAEFAADLNNLSNRMAQLENSLDAKIDSLVSSYLTRNGIWNGAKQDLKYTKVLYNMNELYGAYNDVSVMQYIVTGPGAANTTTVSRYTMNLQGYSIPSDNKLLRNRIELVESTNKSGLLTIEYVGAMASNFRLNSNTNNLVKWFNNQTGYEDLLEIVCYTEDAMHQGYFVGIPVESDADDSSFWTLRKGFKFLEGTDSGGYVYKTNRVLSTSNSGALGATSFPRMRSVNYGTSRVYLYTTGVVNGIVNPQLCFDTFFVAKGNKILLELYDDWSGRDYTKYKIYGEYNNEAGLKAFMACQINGVYIY